MQVDEELEAEQGLPEGETASDPGDEKPAPEQESEDGAEPEASEGEGEQPVAEGEEAEPDGDQPKPKKTQAWELRRIDELTKKRREAERERDELRAELERFRAGSHPDDKEEPQTDIERIRTEERQRIRQEEAARIEQERFNAACNATFEKGLGEFRDEFVEARDNLMSALGDEIQRRPEFLQAITDLDNGHQVFYELGKNPEEAERILAMSPVKMAMEIAGMSAKAATPKDKPISKAPPPVKPLGGSPKTSDRLDDPDMDMDVFARKFLKDMAPKGVR